ncbi:MAG TPA: STAS/SEC14 domain-containing protein [Candidatus Saccharimonadales bacterium]|nr:STAS/SEC14 domain-containing protein [Candidatus Saccharimonadales bacterium]
MQNHVYLDDGGIIVIDTHGPQDEASIESMGHEIEALITEQRKLGKPALILDSLLDLGPVGPDGRKLVVQLAKTLDYDRAVMVGKGGLMRFGTNLMLRATGRSHNVRYYDNEQEARSWLKAYKPGA